MALNLSVFSHVVARALACIPVYICDDSFYVFRQFVFLNLNVEQVSLVCWTIKNVIKIHNHSGSRQDVASFGINKSGCFSLKGVMGRDVNNVCTYLERHG